MLTIGAVFTAGWASNLGKAKNDIGMLGSALAKNKERQKTLDAPDYSGHKKNMEALSKAKKALSNYEAVISPKKFLTDEDVAIMRRHHAEVDKATKAFEASGKAIRNREIALKAEGKSIDEITRKNAKLADTMRRQAKLGAAWSDFKNRTSDLGKTAAKGIGIVTAATTAAYKFVNATAAQGAATEQSAARLGMAVSSLQEFQFMAGRCGMETSALESGLDRLGQGLDDAILKRSGPAHAALQRLGLDAQALATLPADKRLEAIADALSGIADENARASISADIFGKDAGRGFNTMLSGGGKALAAGRADARATGAVYDTKGSSDYQKSLQDMKTSWQGLGRVIGMQLMPAFTRLNQTIGAAITGNGGQVGKALAALSDIFASIVPIIGGVIKVAASVFSVFGKLPWLTQAIAIGFGAVGLAIGAIKFAMFIKSIGVLIAALIGFIPVAWAAVAPFLPFILAAAAVGIAIYALWKNWDTVTAWLSTAWQTAWDGVKSVFISTWEGIKSAAQSAFDFLKTIFSWSPLGLVIKGYGFMFKWLENKFAIFSKIGSAFSKVKGWFSKSKPDTPAADTAIDTPDTTIPISAGGPRTVTNSIGKIEIHAPEGVDAEEVARLAAKRIQEQQSFMLDNALADPA